MNQAFSSLLSPAVGIMISPFPIVGLILILLSDKARKNSITYMLGWIMGTATVFTIAMLSVSVTVTNQSDPGPLKRLVFIALGALMLWLAWREFSKRPKEGEPVNTPKWFDKMASISPIGAAGFGFFLSGLNPKNLLLSLGAGASVGALALPGGEEVVLAVVFTGLASLTIIIPTVLFLILGHRMGNALKALEAFLISNNAVITALLLMMIGLNMIGKAF